jgi:hypothetical protein
MRANEFINEGMWDRAKEWANQKVYNLTGSENARSAAVKTNFLRTFNGKLNAYINSTKGTNTTDIPHFIQSYLIQNKFMDPNHPVYSQNAKLNTEVGRVSGELTAKPNDNMLKTTLGNLIYQVATTASAPMAKPPAQATFNNQPNANYNTTPISNIPTQPSIQPTVATQTPNVSYNSTTVGKPAMQLPSYSANITQPTQPAQTTQTTQPTQPTQPGQTTSNTLRPGALTGWQSGSTASAPQPNATPRSPRSLSQVAQNPNFGK